VGKLTPALPSPVTPALLTLAGELTLAQHFHEALPKQVGACSPHRGYPLSICSHGTGISGAHGTETIGETVLNRLSPPEYTGNRQKHTPIFL